MKEGQARYARHVQARRRHRGRRGGLPPRRRLSHCRQRGQHRQRLGLARLLAPRRGRAKAGRRSIPTTSSSEDLSDADRAHRHRKAPTRRRSWRRLNRRRLGAAEALSLCGSRVAGHQALVSRTGYTGEDGFELYIAPEAAVPLVAGAAGRRAARGPGAGGPGRPAIRCAWRCASRCTATTSTRRTTPLEAGLDFVVKFDKEDFVGKEALDSSGTEGVPRRLIGFQAGRAGHPPPRATRCSPMGAR